MLGSEWECVREVEKWPGKEWTAEEKGANASEFLEEEHLSCGDKWGARLGSSLVWDGCEGRPQTWESRIREGGFGMREQNGAEDGDLGFKAERWLLQPWESRNAEEGDRMLCPSVGELRHLGAGEGRGLRARRCCGSWGRGVTLCRCDHGRVHGKGSILALHPNAHLGVWAL